MFQVFPKLKHFSKIVSICETYEASKIETVFQKWFQYYEAYEASKIETVFQKVLQVFQSLKWIFEKPFQFLQKNETAVCEFRPKDWNDFWKIETIFEIENYEIY